MMKTPIHIMMAWLFFLASLLATPALADRATAWNALRKLDSPRAKQLFAEELKKSPKDPELLRGMVIASFFDLDHTAEADAVAKLIDVNPSDPYLLPVFEHVAAEMTEWAEQPVLERRIADGLISRGGSRMAYIGRSMKLHLGFEAGTKLAPEIFKTMGLARGCWITGPFDNKSNIAMYRAVPFEGKPLDTLSTAVGFEGINAGWTWLPGGNFAEMASHQVVEDDTDIVCQSRTFFELSSDNDVLILLGGAFSYRIFVDGVKIGDDPIFRNSTMRGGFRVHLPKGSHEITMVFGVNAVGSSFDLSVVDTTYSAIAGFRWLRYAKVTYVDSLFSKSTHPLFDAYSEAIANSGEAPDARFWKANLQIYNGFSREAVQELEPLFSAGALSSIELWMLHRALLMNAETLRSNEVLGILKSQATSPQVDLALLNKTEENWEAQIKAAGELSRQFPGRYELEVLDCLGPMLNRDITGVVSALNALSGRYPNAAEIHMTLVGLYAAMKDYNSMLSELEKYAGVMNKKQIEQSLRWRTSLEQGKYDEVCALLRKTLEIYPETPNILRNLAASLKLSGRTAEAIRLMDSITAVYPYDAENLSDLYSLYNQAGEYGHASDILLRVYRLKPSAILPYLNIDSLHYSISYDSIFGAVDVMKLWDTEPSEREMAGQDSWRILDRRQKIIFKAGVVLNDVHWAMVAYNQEGVESMQEISSPITRENGKDQILVARRLRKGQPPLPAVKTENSFVFKDLRPGDAVEFRYRIWTQNGGDLWQHFWDSYVVRAGSYQRYWEYTIITDRKDLSYRAVPPNFTPTEISLGGFRKLTWKGEKLAGTDLSLYFLPPSYDIMGSIYFSTLTDWQTVNQWYSSISEAILSENPRSDALADKLTASLTTDRDKLAALYKYIVIEIPYQVIAFDYDASIPHKPDEVLVNRWGDCKDKAHLLVRMLRHCGISAWTALTLTRDNGTMLPLPSFSFDHLIVGCVIDGDTLMVDPADTPYPPIGSLASDIAGQPHMLVGLPVGDTLSRVPDGRPDNWRWNRSLTLQSRADGQYDFTFEADSYNLEAGVRREEARDIPSSELAKTLQKVYIDSWGVDLTVDSTAVDSTASVDSVFVQKAFGVMKLQIQTVGKTTVIKLPSMTFLPKTWPTAMGVNGTREFPVDLHDLVMQSHRTVELTIPVDYGKPNLPPPLQLKEKLISFTSSHTWNAASRRLAIDFDIEIKDGTIDLDSFIALIKAVNERFDAPLLFEKI